MKRCLGPIGIAFLMVCIGMAAWVESSVAAEAERDVRGFPNLARRPVQFWSDGTRLAGDLTYPKGIKEGEKLPAIVLCHGWGGVKAHLNPQIAPMFAAGGYVVLAFDYRGWGESDSRLVVLDEMPKPDSEGNVTVKAQAVRQLVDPLDQQEDIDAALTFIEGEAMVDTNRIGIWGSSFGGGHVIYRAAIDPRVKCVAAQVGAMDQRSGLEASYKERGQTLDALHQQEMKRVRGEMAPVPFNENKQEGLTGTPYFERFVDFVPVAMADKIKVPVIIIDAELEHYFDNKDHGHKVYEILKANNVPVEYHELKGKKHYDVYTGDTLRQVMALEIPWFDKHLKNKSE